MAGKKADQIDPELLAQLIPEGMIVQNTGFPPYWVPEIGQKFSAFVEDKDLRSDDDQEEVSSGNFTRYKFIANEDLNCKTGPATDPEDVRVGVGDSFTCSAYGSLNLDDYIGFDVTVVVTGNRKLPGNKASKGAPRDMWTFVVLTDAATDRKVKEAKKLAAAAKRRFIQARRLQGLGTVNSLPNGTGTKVVDGDIIT